MGTIAISEGAQIYDKDWARGLAISVADVARYIGRRAERTAPPQTARSL